MATSSTKEIPVGLVIGIFLFIVFLYGFTLLYKILDMTFGNLYRVYKDPKKVIKEMNESPLNGPSTLKQMPLYYLRLEWMFSSFYIFYKAPTRIKISLVVAAAVATLISLVLTDFIEL